MAVTGEVTAILFGTTLRQVTVTARLSLFLGQAVRGARENDVRSCVSTSFSVGYFTDILYKGKRRAGGDAAGGAGDRIQD